MPEDHAAAKIDEYLETMGFRHETLEVTTHPDVKVDTVGKDIIIGFRGDLDDGRQIRIAWTWPDDLPQEEFDDCLAYLRKEPRRIKMEGLYSEIIGETVSRYFFRAIRIENVEIAGHA